MDRVIDGRYRITEPIGSGGSSQVYVARDLKDDRDVALKVLDERAAADNAARSLFTKEARMLRDLSHPNIVAIYDVGEVDGRPYIAMEHVQGASLRARIERTGALPATDVALLAQGIAEGLAFAHSKGIVHADLKPSNILIDLDDHPKLADFGIARSPSEDAETPQLFATAMYVAPERVEGKAASSRSDIYGFGLIVYEMLVGRPPFTSTSASVLLRDHVVRQPVPPSHLRPSLPKEVDRVILKALAKDPALRYRNATELAHELVRALEGYGSSRVIARPIEAFVPTASQSPVVALLSEYGQPIRHAFFGVLAAVPTMGLTLLADFDLLPALLFGGLITVVALTGQLGIAIGIGWVIQTLLLFLFVPGLAVIFALVGLVLWLRGVSAEQIALATAMPAAARFGLAPALLLTGVAVQGLSGIITVGWGALLTMVFAIASGRQSLGPFVQTGLTLEQEPLFSPLAAAQMKSAIIHIFQPRGGQPAFGPLMEEFAPDVLFGEMGSLVSRLTGADITAIATVVAWLMAALVVWTVTRLLRSLFDVMLRRRAWFVLYVFATAVGIAAGAAVLYMLFVTTPPLDLAPGRLSDNVLLVSASVGAALAIAAGVVLSATEKHEVQDEPTPDMSGRRSAVR